MENEANGPINEVLALKGYWLNIGLFVMLETLQEGGGANAFIGVAFMATCILHEG